ncbi:GAF domain-containing sensor histidine kinase [Agrobacterium pusense]|uniref:GAF domain-containing sensor histidine kinase n=1 Tax=Agrobacterium pusense TaxID=648995 RepID=UPI00156ACDDF|nr:GAF domain-containing sensor histidine kinase [Agrobacterium pusense]QKJ93546.1 GAF domain-containing sensor histidine kinase [Agrobacterium pusense]
MLDTPKSALFYHYMGISRLLAGQLEFNAIIQAVATEISHIIPHDHMDVCIKQLDDKYHIAYESGLVSAWSKHPPALLTGSPIRSLLSGEVEHLLSGDACADPRFHFNGAFSSPIHELDLHSRLHVPMKVHGDIIGALSCSCHRADAYTMEDVTNARAVADLLAPYFYAIRAAEQAKRSAIEEARANAREEGLRLGALQLTEALEAERQRIGMDLHDQTLADLTRLARRIERMSHTPDVSGEMLEPVVRSLQHCMQDLREIIEEAKPSILQLFGVVEAIETYVDRSVRDSGCAIDWSVTDETEGLVERLDKTVAISLFRIVQEAVNNAIRHAQPETIAVRLTAIDGGLRVTVSDDGNGGGDSGAPGGLGMDNMKTRARLISARFDRGGNRDGAGTCITVTLPAGAFNFREEM